MNADIFIPVRLNSLRLPNKHLKVIGEKPLLQHLIDRLKTAQKIRNVVVCTTTNVSDDPLIQFLENEKISYFRGNEKDILVRFLDAAKRYGTDIIVDVEGDKIYTDPIYVDLVVSEMEKNNHIDYVMGSNFDDRIDHTDHSIAAVFPAGIRTTSLKTICELKKTDNTETGYREFFTNNPSINCKYLVPKIKQNIPKNLRLTLDYQEDLDLAVEIFRSLGNYFHFDDVLKLLSNNPNLLKITEPAIKKWEQNYKMTQTDYSLKI